MNINKRHFVLIFLSLAALISLAISLTIILKEKAVNSTFELVSFIKENHDQGHLKAFTFTQETIRFDSDGKAIDTTIWYEAIRYPNDFRIDFGDPQNGNANLNRNDSIYVFRGNKLVYSGEEVQEFLILEGGIFYYSVQETIERLESLGIDTKTFTKSSYRGNPVYIIGALDNDFTKPQIWLDAENFNSVRRFSKGKQGELFEIRYDDFKDIDGFRIETWVEFLIDEKLIQTERYKNIDIKPNLSDQYFDPSLFGRKYWFIP